MKKIEVKTSDEEIIVIEKEKSDEEPEAFDNVYVLDISDNKTYGLEINPQSDTLGYKVDENSELLCRYEKLPLWCYGK